MGASLDSVVTEQPVNNNHLPPRAIVSREVNELPLHADKLYEVRELLNFLKVTKIGEVYS